MRRLQTKSDYEELRNARINEIQARLASAGIQKTATGMRSLASSPNSDHTHVRKNGKVDYGSTPVRRSARLNGESPPLQGKLEDFEDSGENYKRSAKRSLKMEEASPAPEMLHAKLDYEELRKMRIMENQARLASIGLHKTISDLRTMSSSRKANKTPLRKNNKVDYSSTPLRRSARLSGNVESPTIKGETGKLGDLEDSGKSIKKSLKKRKISPEALARRCMSKGRGSLYDPLYGICCHFCRQKKLCGEEDCRRCGELDMDQPCIGKTECSICHSSNGVLCRACLKVRYGQEMEEVRANKEWMCPHCVEDKGLNPYWICNSSLCLKKRKMVPTGIAIYRAREMGFKSVAHLLMDKLQQGDRKWGK